MYDVVVVGGGPAGASAATFAARAGLSTVVIDADKGLTRMAMVNNHLGFPDGITGPDLVDAGRAQAERSGAEWVEGVASGLTSADGVVTVTTEAGAAFEAKAAILTLGTNVTLAKDAGLETRDGTEPRIKTILAVDADGRTTLPGVWAAGTVAGVSVHTIVTAGDGARVAVNVISEQKGERWVDHDMLPKE